MNSKIINELNRIIDLGLVKEDCVIDIKRIIDGWNGEKIAREIYIKRGYTITQIDFIAMKESDIKCIEVKNQEPFDPPPFKGHGLPAWQIDSKMKLFIYKQIEPILFVIDKKDNCMYEQSIVELLKNKSFQTKGIHPRKIFPIDSFNLIKK